MSSRSNTEVIAVLRHSKAATHCAWLMYVGTYDSSGKLETRHGCRQCPPKDLCHPVDLCGGDDQRGKETHHAAMAPAQLRIKPRLRHSRCTSGASADGPAGGLDVGRAARVDQFHPEHQATPANVPQLREVALQDAQVLSQALPMAAA